MKKLYVSTLLLLFVANLICIAQDDLKIFHSGNSKLDTDNINDLAVDKDNNIWIATSKGIAKFNGKTIEDFELSQYGLPKFIDAEVVEIDINGTIWFGTRNGLIRFDGSEWTIFSKKNSEIPKNWIQTLLSDNKGNLWIGFGFSGGGLVKYDGSEWKIWDKKTSEIGVNVVNSLQIDNNGNLWIGSQRSVVRFNMESGVSEEHNRKALGLPGINDIDISSITMDKDGVLWFGGDIGLLKYDGSSWERITSDDSEMEYRIVQNIVADETGSLWISSGGFQPIPEGSDIHSEQIYSHYSSSGSTVRHDGGRLVRDGGSPSSWHKMLGGLYRYDGVEWELFRPSEGLPDWKVPLSIHSEDGFVNCLVVDNDFRIWLGTNYRGLIQMPDDISAAPTPVPLSEAKIAARSIEEALKDPGHVRKLTLRKTELTPDIAKLYNLQSLTCTDCELTVIPDYVFDLNNLTNLDFENNKISEIPAAINKLTFLQELRLKRNNIASIPAEIGALTNLQSLSITSSPISDAIASIAPEIGKLKNLYTLEIRINLTELPPEFWQINSLYRLSIHGSLNVLPPEISGLKNLTDLTIMCPIKELPDEIGNLVRLKTLWIVGNEISEIPDSFTNLVNLRNVNLDGRGELSKLPDDIGNLQNLNSLILRGTHFSSTEKERIKNALPNTNIEFRE